MMATLHDTGLRLVRRLDPERAHRLAIRTLSLGLGGAAPACDPRLAVTALGLRFPNPIGIAAGFDKNAEAVRPLARLGFGFVEAGTVTPLPQMGNPRPRLFRLEAERAVINRFGFNNDGIAAFTARLRRMRKGSPLGVPFGVNLGINKTGADPLRDYPALVAATRELADYIVINLSSPNTPGLRDLQRAGQIRAILEAVAAANPARPPVLVKLAPDLAEDDLPALVEALVAGGAAGAIVSNTTVARPPGLRGRHAAEAGGLSGPPLRDRSTAMLRAVSGLAAGRLVLVGCGGIASGADILDKLEAGAQLVQLYTSFAYEGPALLARLKAELVAALDARGVRALHALTRTA